MNLAFLQTFLAVVAAGNLNRAADTLHVTQSTVTARINTLEDQLGQSLLKRSKAGTAMTSAGFKFQRYAELIMQAWQQAKHEIALPESCDTVCNIGCHFDLWAGVGQAWFDGVRKAHPEVALSAWGGEQAEIDRWLASGLIDVAICHRPAGGDSTFTRHLFDDRIVLVTSESSTDMKPYPGPPHLYVDLGQDFRRRHAAAYPEAKAAALIFGTASWALGHMLDNPATGYLPMSLAAPHLADGSLRLVENAIAFARAVYLVGDAGRIGDWPWFDSAADDLATAGAAVQSRPSHS
ncbi:MAG: LysR family transcriptional regulator [Rhodospirillales bacterium]